ncbi:MAG: beta-lactamase class, partial [Streptosporangiaceae bacterium]|nr:beta-lactamase class [Streptosporangiaceae bacterium]
TSLDAIGYGLEHISDFLVTHVHRDHYTQAVAIRRTHGTRISLGVGERPTVALLAPERRDGPSEIFVRLRRHGAGELVDSMSRGGPGGDPNADLWQPPDRWIENETTINIGARSLRAIATPGHTQGHMVFLDAAGEFLFAGDHVLPQITPSVGFETQHARNPLGDYLTSLRLLKTMPDALLLPAHGPVTPSVHSRVDELLAHHVERLDKTLSAVDMGADTAALVAARLAWTRRGRAFAELDPYNQMLAVLETAAHLEVLAERGMLTATESDGRRRYELATG